MSDKPLEPLAVNVKEAARLVGLAVSTLNEKRQTGKDCPPFFRVGTSVLYPIEGLKAWIASRPTFTNTTAADLYEQMQKEKA